MRRNCFAAAIALAIAATSTTPGAEAILQIELGSANGDFERRSVAYDCSDGAPIDVVYVNAAPNFLALVPVAEEPQPLLFSAVLSGSGVRYAAGKWIWWTDGAEATLYDATLDEEAPPVLTCSEFVQTP